MKNIFGRELGEKLSTLYEYALSPNGGRSEALMMAQANDLEQELQTVINQDYDAVKFIHKVFYERFHVYLSSFKTIPNNRLISGFYEFDIEPLFKWAQMVEAGITAWRRADAYGDGRTLISDICPIGRDGKYRAKAWLVYRGCYDRIIRNNVIENLKEKAQVTMQSYITRIDNRICKKQKLPKIDWGMVKFNITI
jgi:hypothetical protein